HRLLGRRGDRLVVGVGVQAVAVVEDRDQRLQGGANVIEIHTTLPIDKDTDLKKLVLAQERFDFFERTKLRALIPEADINLTLPGQYEKLLEHIAVHRYFMGETAAEPVSEEDAVKHWYDDVYTPLAAVIQKDELLADFPGRTTADLYLWIVEHMWYLREGHNKPVTMEEAAQHFTRNYSRTTKQRLRKLLDSMASFVEDVEKNPEPPMSEPPNPEDEAPSEAS
ncbi:MAG TPA: DUF4032 domain-containing protein, partial [Bellilinea sp.]|nr:DUF4032 domain-containing protein [Bellilinea sp.]